MTNLSIAKLGFPAMAIGSCFGAPMMNLLLGIGVSCLYSIVIDHNGEPYILDVSRTVYVSGVGVVCGLCFSFGWISINGYRAGRVFGSILVAGYFVVMGISLYMH